jgi:AraC-like DNA-binding protein
MVTLRYFAPAPPLRDFVSSYYLFRSDQPVVADLLRAELAQVRFTIQGQGCYRFADGRVAGCPPAMLTGPSAAPILFEATGPLTVVGAGLMPAGWAALIGCGADELADDVVPLDAVLGASALRTFERLATARDAKQQVAALDDMFLAVANGSRGVPLWFTRAMDHWLVGSPAPRIDDLVAAAGVSSRHVERLSARIYGGPPKLLGRKYRALQAAVRIGTGRATNWTDAAGDAFYDQPHFIREFKQFVGMTPHRFAIRSGPVMRLTIAGRQQLPTLPKLALYS